MKCFNFNKHKHRGYPYLSYKSCTKNKKKSHNNFAKRCIRKYLKDFWTKFYTLNPTQKIDLLKEASYQKYKYHFSYYHNRRKKHRFSYIPCKVCGKQPTLIHHIILVKNGGISKKINYIRICEMCHAEIHEWLLDDLAQKLNEQMDAEYRAIVGL